ncbi:MAG: hypothetical protein HY574_01200 [candidate division NC10 bacterium]|nr:hypothetical protein [candidate division NC10 bacterium]
MFIRTKLQIGHVVIFILAMCIGTVVISAVRTWQAVTDESSFSYAQSLRAEGMRGDIYFCS